MNAEWNLLCKILQDGDFLSIKEATIDKSYFKEPQHIPLWTFIETHYDTYHAAPSIQVVEQKFNIKIDAPKETLAFWIKEIQNQKINEELAEIGRKITDKVSQDDPRGALDLFIDFTKNTAIHFVGSGKKTKKAHDLKDKIWQAYLDAKAGKMGIPTPWKTMNEWTMGWWKKDVSCFVARSGQGKTFLLLDVGVAAIEAGHDVLFISCEMSEDDIGQRYFSNKFKINYGGIRKGKLSFFEEQGYKNELDSYKPLHDMEIYDGSLGLHITDVERAIRASKADLVIVDSCYRITARQKAKDRFDNMAYVFQDLKLFSQLYDKAIIVSTQLNRDYAKKKKDESADMADIALSDVVSWTSTNIFSLRKGDQNDMKIFPLKIREGENQKTQMLINWDMVKMNFDEIVQSAATTSAASAGKVKTAATYVDNDLDEDDWVS